MFIERKHFLTDNCPHKFSIEMYKFAFSYSFEKKKNKETKQQQQQTKQVTATTKGRN